MHRPKISNRKLQSLSKLLVFFIIIFFNVDGSGWLETVVRSEITKQTTSNIKTELGTQKGTKTSCLEYIELK